MANITEDNFVQVVQGILQNDNEIRKQAEELLNQYKLSEPDQYVLLLLNNLKSSQLKEIRQFCAIGLRKNLSKFSEKSYVNIWASLSQQTQDIIKRELIEIVQVEVVQNIRHQICDAISEIAGSIFNEEIEGKRRGISGWVEIIPQIYTLYNSGITRNIESSLKIMSSLFEYATTDFVQNQEILHKIFSESIMHLEVDVRIAGIEAFGQLITLLEAKEYKVYQDIIPQLLSSIIQLVESGSDNGDSTLSVLFEIMEGQGKFMKNNFMEVFRGMQRIAQLNDIQIQENTKQLAIEIIVEGIQQYPKVIRDNGVLLRDLFELIFTRMIDIQQDIDNEWLKPPEGYNQHENEENDSNVKFGMNCIDTLISEIGQQYTLPLLSNMVESMLMSSSDWRVQHAALMALSQVGEYLDNIKQIEPIVNLIIQLIPNQNPKIRYASIHCIGQFAEDMTPKFQEYFNTTILNVLINALDDPVPRVQGHVLAALTNYLEGSDQVQVLSVLSPVLEKSFSILQNGISICKENALNCISAISQAAKEAYIPYYDKSLQILYQILKNLQSREYKQLRGQCLESITLTSVAAGIQYFSKYARDIIEILIQIQQNYNEEIDPNATYIFSSWHRICILLQSDFIQYLPTVIPSLFNMVQNIFVQAAKEEQQQQEDIVQLNEKVQIDKKQNVNTSYTEDAEIAIHMISVFIDELKGEYIDYVEQTAKIVLPLVNFQSNQNIRKVAAKSLPELIECVKLSNKVNKESIVCEMGRMFIKEIWDAINTEFEPDVILDQIQAVKEIIEHSGRFMSQIEIEQLATKILLLLQESHQRKNENEKYKDEEDVEQEEIEILDEENDMEDDVHIAIAELCGILFKTHKELTLQFAKIIYTQILTEVLKPEQSSANHQFGIFLVDDMIEYFGIELIPDEWPYLCEALLRYALDSNPSVRQAACYGIGVLAIKSSNTFQTIAEHCLNILVQAINIPKGNENEKSYYHSRDNAIASLGKIIQAYPDKIDLVHVCSIWIQYLPLQHDQPEALIQHSLLKDILINSPQLVLGDSCQNLQQILKIFGDIVNTKYCDDNTKNGFKEFLVRISQDSTFKNALSNLVLTDKQRKTLEELYSSK